MADNRKLIDAKRFSFVYTVSAKSKLKNYSTSQESE